MCVFHVSSLTHSFKDFIEQSNLQVYRHYEKGQKHKIKKSKTYTDYGFSCDISKKPWTDVEGQFNDIILFVEQHKEDLTILKRDFNINDWRFDLPYECRLSDSVFCQSDYLSPRLMRLISHFEIGLEMSQYWGQDEELVEVDY